MNCILPTRVTQDGICVDAEDSVIGYKCLGCSTTHILDDNTDWDWSAEQISNWQRIHANCR